MIILPSLRRLAVLAGALFSIGSSYLAAQGIGSVRGTVTRSDDGSPLVGVTVTVKGVGGGASTGTSGRYFLERVAAGRRRPGTRDRAAPRRGVYDAPTRGATGVRC